MLGMKWRYVGLLISALPFRCVALPCYSLCFPLRESGAIVRAQGLWNSREEGKWVAVEACKMNREQGIR